MSNYNNFIKDPKKMGKILKSRIYGNNIENEFLHSDSLNQKKYIEHFKLKMNLILEKIKKDEANLKEGKKIEPVKVVKGSVRMTEINPKDEQQEAESEKQQTGQLVKLSNGSHYAGSLKNGMPHGDGKEFMEDGLSYIGSFKDGYWHGYGYLIDSENYLCYGEFYEGRVVGI
jgi:hypothetical protein